MRGVQFGSVMLVLADLKPQLKWFKPIRSDLPKLKEERKKETQTKPKK